MAGISPVHLFTGMALMRHSETHQRPYWESLNRECGLKGAGLRAVRCCVVIKFHWTTMLALRFPTRTDVEHCHSMPLRIKLAYRCVLVTHWDGLIVSAAVRTIKEDCWKQTGKVTQWISTCVFVVGADVSHLGISCSHNELPMHSKQRCCYCCRCSRTCLVRIWAQMAAQA